MALRVRAFDWAKTPLGPMARWMLLWRSRAGRRRGADPVGSSWEDCEHFPGYVALQAADGFLLGLALTDAAGQVILGLLIMTQPGDDDSVQRGVGLAVATPIQPMPLGLARGAGIGEAPHSIEKQASERSRSGLSPAATSSAPAESDPTPNSATSLGAAALVSRSSSASSTANSAERTW